MHSQSSNERTRTPQVSVIIPARNEEENLARCLRSLIVQKGFLFEIIVVDDASSDRTREIAEGFSKEIAPCSGVEGLVELKVICSQSPLPIGWSGKNNACHSGAMLARGFWLLFTDADTEHSSHSIESAVHEAEAAAADLLSYSPNQVLRGFAQHALMPVVFSELNRRFRSRDASNPKSETAVANGQFILIRRDIYEHIGGFAAVGPSLLEDVALATLVKGGGRKQVFHHAKGVVKAHMYRGWRDMRDGWTKNLFLLFPDATKLAVLRCCEFVFLLALPVAAGYQYSLSRNISFVLALLAVLLWTRLLTRAYDAHCGWGATVLSFFGLPLFSYLLARSQKAHRNSRVEWKGRRYSGSATNLPCQQSNTLDVDSIARHLPK